MGASCLVWALLVKLALPERWFSKVRLEDSAQELGEEEEGMVASWRKNHALNRSHTNGKGSQGFH